MTGGPCSWVVSRAHEVTSLCTALPWDLRGSSILVAHGGQVKVLLLALENILIDTLLS